MQRPRPASQATTASARWSGSAPQPAASAASDAASDAVRAISRGTSAARSSRPPEGRIPATPCRPPDGVQLEGGLLEGLGIVACQFDRPGPKRLGLPPRHPPLRAKQPV